MIPNCKPVGKSYVNDINKYVHIDKLRKHLFNENLYTLVEMKDEVMGISKDNIPDRVKRSKALDKFVSGLGDNFTIGVFMYSSQSTLVSWYAVLRLERIQFDRNSDFIEICINVTK